jgi:DNA-binding NarL/FixJ family response regulator
MGSSMNGNVNHNGAPAAAHRGLTPREWEVLHLLATGTSEREIASRLSIRTNTVRTHLKSIYGKLDVPGRLQAMLWALTHLQPPP